MPWVARKIHLTELQTEILEELTASRTARADHRVRATIVLKSAQGLSTTKISEIVFLSADQVSMWRNRWADHEEVLLRIEKEAEKRMDYCRYIESLLSDLPRSGAPVTFSAEQLCQIYAVATESPEASGLPFSHWSLSSLVNELVNRGIVESISTSQLSVFLKSSGAKAA